MPAVGDFLAVELRHHVAVLQPGLVRRSVCNHVADERAGWRFEVEFLRERRRDVLNHDAQITAGDVAIFDKAFHHGAGQIGRDGKPNALAAARITQDGGVDADQPAVNVHQRTAGISRIDGRVGLDEILVILDTHVAAVLCADDAFGNCLAYAKGIAHGQHDIADLHIAAVGQRDDGQTVRVNFHDRDVGLGIAPDDFGGELAPIRQRDFHFFGPVHDVVVGEDITVLGDDHAGAEAVFNSRAHGLRRQHPAKLVAKKLPQGVWQPLHRRILPGGGDLDLDHGGRDLVHDGRVAAARQAIPRHRRLIHGHVQVRRIGFVFRSLRQRKNGASQHQAAGQAEKRQAVMEGIQQGFHIQLI